MEGWPKITVCENGVVIIEHPVKKNDYLEDEDGDEQQNTIVGLLGGGFSTPFSDWR